MRETVLVTGAGGFIGGTVVEALHFAGQHEVRAGIRRWGTGVPRIARLPVQIVPCDLTDPAELTAALAEVDYVIHCATSNDIAQVTANLLNAAAASKVRRLVHLSSIAVYGAATGIVDETVTAPPGRLSQYATAKLRAEEYCCAAAKAGLDVVMLRPSIVYGPFSTLWTAVYAVRLRTGRWGDLGEAANGKCNLVHVHDVVRHAVAALSGAGLAGEAYNVNGPEIITWNQYFHAFNAKLGLPPLRSQLPGKVRFVSHLTKPLRSAGKLALRNFSSQLIWLSQRNAHVRHVMKVAELRLRCTPNEEELRLFGQDAIYTTAKAEQAFGICSRVGVEEGLTMTGAWLNHIGEYAFG